MPYTFVESQKLFTRAARSIAGGVNSGIRKMEAPVPLYFTHGKGARLWDVDGNEYIDYQIGQGALLFGHAPAGLAVAVGEQAKRGTHWAAQSLLEIEVAERIQKLIPSAELVRCNNSATEVVGAALRLARAHTGRPLILKFEGHYHGWGDEGLVGFAPPPDRWGPDDAPSQLHPSEGIIPEVATKMIVARWNDPAHLRQRVKQYSGKIAAIIFEPVLCNTSCIVPCDGLLKTIRELCDEEGMLMIADETITGFRLGGAGAQGYLGFSPDLTILGKAVGGGTPFAVLAGKAKYMEKIIKGAIVHAGTLNGNPLCLAASKWSLDQILEQRETHPQRINELGQTLMGALEDCARRHAIPLRAQGPGLVFHTTMLKPGAAEGKVNDYRDYIRRHDAPRWAHLRRCLLEEGVRAIERGLWFVSLAHTDQDLADTLPRVERAFARHAATWPTAA